MPCMEIVRHAFIDVVSTMTMCANGIAMIGHNRHAPEAEVDEWSNKGSLFGAGAMA